MKEVHDHINVNQDAVDGCDTTAESYSDDYEDDDNGPSTSGKDNEALLEEPMTEEEVEELVAELLEIESKAAEAQEALESESLEKVEHDVRVELSETLHGDVLEKAVADEMEAFREEWENALDELETESGELLEQLDGAGIDLPSIYKWIETQAPNGCCTEAWRKRTHWIGSQLTRDAAESIERANEKLQVVRPVRRRHGKILEEGASGYLEKKLAPGDSSAVAESSKVEWSSFNKLISGQTNIDKVTFGSKNWSSVYLASTPQQAAIMGIDFPGVNEVEEIGEIEGDSGDPFVADALANEKELDLSEEQRKNYRKVKEEDDAKVNQKLQHHLKRRRHRRKHNQDCSTKFSVKIEDDVSTNIQSAESQGSDMEDLEDGCRVAKNSKVTLIDCDDGADSLADKNASFTFQGTKMDIQPDLLENEHQSVNEKLGSLIDVFHCTVCNKVVNAPLKHPLLEVLVCRECKCAVEMKMSAKLPQSLCGWCGCSSDLINCRTCKILFCKSCIRRNLGNECLSGLNSLGWKCCSCSPHLLQPLSLEFKKACEVRDITNLSSDSSGSDSNTTEVISTGSFSSSRKKKKIRRILDDAELGEETKRKIAIEKERQERLKSLQALWSSKPLKQNTMTPPEGATSDVLGDASTGFVVNIVREKGEDAVRIPPSISARLKAHQIAGIRFMWENIIQSITKVKAGDKGLGCILAHTMGLGKTLQVIAFLYTIMRREDLGMRSALIVVPVNVLHNWRHEFQKWSPQELKPLRVFMLDDVSRDCQQRAKLLMKWKRKGGVFLIGYSSFRHLCLGRNVKDHPASKQICYALQEGPDILVCDEAHIIKNNFAEITQALKQVKCQRRIALTGSPLQNNLMEYYCMVDFVREGFLGSSHEFRNRFQNPIENGQHTNSTADDVRIMNQRSHILYEQLKGFVQRMDMSVVKKDLPPKTVFVISVKLSPCQRKLYKAFLNFHGLTGSSEGFKGTNFFALYQALAQILNHPWILQLMKQRVQVSAEDDDTLGLDDGSSDENTDYNMKNGEKSKDKNVVPPRRSIKTSFQEAWWKNILNEDIHQKVEYSGKMVLLLDILTMSADVCDKVLVFSQSISTLDLIEFYLSKLPRQGKEGRHWKCGKDWYRIDGKTKGSDRQKLVELFNDPKNKRVKCTLISTKAGSLGINLYAANRVVIMDGLWNPTFELQAICRAWRYGQKKPVYAYRLMAHKTMEEKIYKRQVTKEGLAARVVDRQQVHRTVSKEEMLHLFEFGDDETLETMQENGSVSNANNGGKLFKQKLSDSASCSSDKLMEALLSRHNSRWITNYHEHESLLQENEEEKLTKEEQDMAWEVFRKGLDPRKSLDLRKNVDFEWEEVQRVSIGDQEPSLNPQNNHSKTSTPPQPESESWLVDPDKQQDSTCIPLPIPRLRYRMPKRRCTLLSHRLTLRSQRTKPGCSTICGECAREIRWEDVGGPPGKIIPLPK